MKLPMLGITFVACVASCTLASVKADEVLLKPADAATAYIRLAVIAASCGYEVPDAFYKTSEAASKHAWGAGWTDAAMTVRIIAYDAMGEKTAEKKTEICGRFDPAWVGAVPKPKGK
jgi:hypothetical protein